MTAVAALLAAVSAFLLFSAPPHRSWRRLRLLENAKPQTGTVSRAHPWVLVGLLSLIGCLIAAHALAGGQGVVMLLVLVMVGATVSRVARSHRRIRGALRMREDVAHACVVLAAQARVGQVPAEALRSAALDCPVLEESVVAQRIGADVVAEWRRSATEPGKAGLTELARAWQVAEQTGAELAGSLEEVSSALNADQALALVVRGELAAPRATGRMLAVLPVVGLGLGYLIGGDPLGFLLDSPYGWVCLVLGALLACIGVLWIEQIANRAAERI